MLSLSAISDIMRSMPLRFRLEYLRNILFKKCGISNQPVTASAMIRVFPSLEHSTDYVRKPTDNFRTFVCPLRHQTTDGIYAIFMSNKT